MKYKEMTLIGYRKHEENVYTLKFSDESGLPHTYHFNDGGDVMEFMSRCAEGKPLKIHFRLEPSEAQENVDAPPSIWEAARYALDFMLERIAPKV